MQVRDYMYEMYVKSKKQNSERLLRLSLTEQ